MTKLFQIIIIIGIGSQSLYSQEYNFTIAGHLYGSPQSKNQFYPAESLLANSSFIKSFKSDFFISLGDNCQIGNDSLSTKIFEDFFSKEIQQPIYTAYGNHDGDRKLIEKHIGRKTFYAFEYRNDLYVFFDSELDNKKLDVECLNFGITALGKAAKKNNLRNIFYFFT